jgi:hypothetical protein
MNIRNEMAKDLLAGKPFQASAGYPIALRGVHRVDKMISRDANESTRTAIRLDLVTMDESRLDIK